MVTTSKQPLLVTAFVDYICPFCYVGDARLEKLRDEFDLKVNWCFVEIHPDTPAEGMDVRQLGYGEEKWNAMMQALEAMAAEELLPLAPRQFTTNSHKALLLAEAAKADGPEVFYRLHHRLFEAFFAEGQNIGDEEVLRQLANECGVSKANLNAAWSDPKLEQRLESNLEVASQNRLSGVPTFVIHGKPITGAVPVETLREAARAGDLTHTM